VPVQQIVIQLEFESDTPGVIDAWGPFAAYPQASTFADAQARASGLERGKEIQVVPLRQPPRGGK
jgi:hypothetical protein